MYTLINSFDQLTELQDNLAKTDVIALDTEGTGLDPFTSKLLLVQFKLANQIYIIDVRNVQRKLLDYIIDLLHTSNKIIIAHNAKYDLKVLRWNFKHKFENVYDTMVGEALIRQGLDNTKFYSYAYCVKKYFNKELDKDVRKSFIDFDGIITQDMLIYSALDVEFLAGIREKQLAISEEQNQRNVIDLEMKLVPVVADMEYHGIRLDVPKWEKRMKDSMSKRSEYEKLIKEHLAELLKGQKYKNTYEMAQALNFPKNIFTKSLTNELKNLDAEFGMKWVLENFNVSSPFQVRAYLGLDGLQVDSTDSNLLEGYKNKFKSVSLILEYKAYDKEATSFGETFLKEVNPVTGRIHAEANQVGTVSGRFSYSNPNLQQVKRESDYRHSFISDDEEHYVILSADYSQAELRIMGWISREPLFIEAYKTGQDLHRLTASNIFEVGLEEVKKEQRQIGKNINFSLIYGISPWGLEYRYGIPVSDGKVYMSKYFSTYKNIRQTIDIAGRYILKNGYSTTLFGRKRFFERKRIYKDNWERQREERKIIREGVNHMVQGLCADAMKLSQVEIYYTNPFGSKLQMLLQMHDELVFQIHRSVEDEAVEFATSVMQKNLQRFIGEIPAVVEYAQDENGEIPTHWSK